MEKENTGIHYNEWTAGDQSFTFQVPDRPIGMPTTLRAEISSIWNGRGRWKTHRGHGEAFVLVHEGANVELDGGL